MCLQLCTLKNWWERPGVTAISAREFGDVEGSYATASEVSLTYFGYPEDGARARSERLEPEIAPCGPIYDADDYRRRFPDGRIGSNPCLATEAIGRELYEAAVEHIAGDYEAFLGAD